MTFNGVIEIYVCTGKGLYDEFSNASIVSNVLSNYYFSVAFYWDKLQYDNILQV